MSTTTPLASAGEPYPVAFDVSRPERFERPQVFLRLAIVFLLSLLLAFTWLIAIIYVAVPVVAALFISRDGAQRYLAESGPRLFRWLRRLVAFDAYITLLTDRFPLDGPSAAVRYDVRPSGSPTVGSALLRLVYSVPSALLLALLGVAAVVTWVIAALMILFREQYADGLYGFHRGVVRWGARLLAYHASLTDRYPPFELGAD